MNTHQDLVAIRRLQANEHTAYRLLRLEALRLFPAHFGATYAEAAAIPRLPFENFIAQQDPDNRMFGAFVGQQLCGICGFRREQRERAQHRGELVHMYVTPGQTKRGIGAGLIATVLQCVLQDPAIQQIVLSVVAANTAAIRLYERAGFREYGRLDRYFRYDGRSSTQLFMVYERA